MLQKDNEAEGQAAAEGATATTTLILQCCVAQLAAKLSLMKIKKLVCIFQISILKGFIT